MEEKNTSFAVTMPEAKELLKAGSQFGHETKRWNPKMRKYILGEKNNIHIINVDKTLEGLSKAVEFLQDASSRGNVLFVGTKKQASDVLREEAIRSGAYFIDTRWAGGLLTNFKMIKESLNKLNSLEKMFEEGVQDRTKYEVSRMKKEWFKLNRLYSGIKTLSAKPTAVVVLDTNYEKSAIKECKKISIPIVALVDTNSNPDLADYPIPANDDAIRSLTLILKTLGDAVLAGNKGNGVNHNLKDYSKVEVKITKNVVLDEKGSEIVTEEGGKQDNSTVQKSAPSRSRSSKGILERVKDEEDKKKQAVKEVKTSKNVATKKTTTPKKDSTKKSTKSVSKGKVEKAKPTKERKKTK